MRPVQLVLDMWFGYLRDQEHRLSPRACIMAGYAYGYGCAALDIGRVDLAEGQIDWLMAEADRVIAGPPAG